MTRVKSEFEEIRRRVKMSRTRKNVMFQNRQRQTKFREFTDPSQPPSVRRQARIENAKTQKLITQQRKRVS